MTDHTYAFDSLTEFEYETNAMTGNEILYLDFSTLIFLPDFDYNFINCPTWCFVVLYGNDKFGSFLESLKSRQSNPQFLLRVGTLECKFFRSDSGHSEGLYKHLIASEKYEKIRDLIKDAETCLHQVKVFWAGSRHLEPLCLCQAAQSLTHHHFSRLLSLKIA